LTQLADTVNGRGADLVTADVLGFYDADYLDDGRDEAVEAESFAAQLAASHSTASLSIRILAYDATNDVIHGPGLTPRCPRASCP